MSELQYLKDTEIALRQLPAVQDDDVAEVRQAKEMQFQSVSIFDIHFASFSYHISFNSKLYTKPLVWDSHFFMNGYISNCFPYPVMNFVI